MKFKYKNIGISGVAGCGKNTLSEIIIKLLQRLELPYRELSIANNLKKELSSSSRLLYGIDSFDCTRREKVLIRPFLVSHGRISRNLSAGRYWIELLNKELDPQKINIITDVRYDEYEKDEVYWIKKEINGVLIHLSRYDEVNGERFYLKGANDAEKENDPKIKEKADFILNWEFSKDPTKRIISSSRLLEWVKRLYV